MKTTTRICHRSKRAFTLIELRVVIAILGLLMAMVTSGGSAIIIKRRTAVATVQLTRLVSAIEEYKLHFGQYPPANPRQNIISNAHHTSLFYELTGAQLRGAAFESPAYQVGTLLSSDVLMNAFGLPRLRSPTLKT
jgi:prepilin-type N-terminal cleavage/methylation domain-containing protein